MPDSGSDSDHDGDERPQAAARSLWRGATDAGRRLALMILVSGLVGGQRRDSQIDDRSGRGLD